MGATARLKICLAGHFIVCSVVGGSCHPYHTVLVPKQSINKPTCWPQPQVIIRLKLELKRYLADISCCWIGVRVDTKTEARVRGMPPLPRWRDTLQRSSLYLTGTVISRWELQRFGHMFLIESVPHWDSHFTVGVASFWPYVFPGRMSPGEKLPVSDAISQSTFLFKTKGTEAWPWCANECLRNYCSGEMC